MAEQDRLRALEWLKQADVSLAQIDRTSDETIRQAHRSNLQASATAALACAVLYAADLVRKP